MKEATIQFITLLDYYFYFLSTLSILTEFKLACINWDINHLPTERSRLKTSLFIHQKHVFNYIDTYTTNLHKHTIIYNLVLMMEFTCRDLARSQELDLSFFSENELTKFLIVAPSPFVEVGESSMYSRFG